MQQAMMTEPYLAAGATQDMALHIATVVYHKNKNNGEDERPSEKKENEIFNKKKKK